MCVLAIKANNALDCLLLETTISPRTKVILIKVYSKRHSFLSTSFFLKHRKLIHAKCYSNVDKGWSSCFSITWIDSWCSPSKFSNKIWFNQKKYANFKVNSHLNSPIHPPKKNVSLILWAFLIKRNTFFSLRMWQLKNKSQFPFHYSSSLKFNRTLKSRRKLNSCWHRWKIRNNQNHCAFFSSLGYRMGLDMAFC